jgi:hypothetical protein
MESILGRGARLHAFLTSAQHGGQWASPCVPLFLDFHLTAPQARPIDVAGASGPSEAARNRALEALGSSGHPRRTRLESQPDHRQLSSFSKCFQENAPFSSHRESRDQILPDTLRRHTKISRGPLPNSVNHCHN